MTYLDVIDTAVKVGLGALISGLSSYWMAKSKSQDDFRHEKIKRHHELLEDAAEQIEKFSHVLLRYWALMIEFVRTRQQNQEWAAEKLEELQKTKAELFGAYSELTSAESKFLLLGCREAQQSLRNYGDLAKRFRRYAWEGNSALTEAELDDYRHQLLESREILFTEVSSLYKSLR